MPENRPEPAVQSITVYWRKHCPYCIRLRWQLRRIGLPTQERDIWQDADAAARVRAITGGDETVPTVVVGTRSLVNPTLDRLLAAVRAEAPHLLDQISGGRATGHRAPGVGADRRTRLTRLLGPAAAWRHVATWSWPRRPAGRDRRGRGGTMA